MADKEMSVGEARQVLQGFARAFRAASELDRALDTALFAQQRVPEMQKELDALKQSIEGLRQQETDLKASVEAERTKLKDAAQIAQWASDERQKVAQSEKAQLASELAELRAQRDLAIEAHNKEVTALAKDRDAVVAELTQARNDLAAFHAKMGALHA